MMDPYCPVAAHTKLPDNANLVAPKGGAAGSMPINTPQVPLSSLSFLLDDFTFQVRQSASSTHCFLTHALAGFCAQAYIWGDTAWQPSLCSLSAQDIQFSHC